jgi:hypothetical protein
MYAIFLNDLVICSMRRQILLLLSEPRRLRFFLLGVPVQAHGGLHRHLSCPDARGQRAFGDKGSRGHFAQAHRKRPQGPEQHKVQGRNSPIFLQFFYLFSIFFLNRF